MSIAFPFAFHISVLFSCSLFFTCHWISFVFLLYGLRICILHSFCSPFTYSLLCEFPGLGLALEPAVVDPEAEQGCAWNRNLEPNFCPGRGRTSDLGIYRSRTLPLDYRTTPFFKSPLRLRHAGGYGGTILTPNPHVILLLIKLQISKLPDFKIFKKLPHHLLL